MTYNIALNPPGTIVPVPVIRTLINDYVHIFDGM